ncbi:helix-turn-helix domain-containing protein [Rhodococcus opacus]|uniref:helix-turn-helix domain-containing protein n=1 Tax=Rhodococcus opacus TaxID=37919 RepID=UPI00389A7CA9
MPDDRPIQLTASLRLTFAEREDIACRRAAGEGIREIARAVNAGAPTLDDTHACAFTHSR